MASSGFVEELVSGARSSLLLYIFTKKRQMVNGCGV